MDNGNAPLLDLRRLRRDEFLAIGAIPNHALRMSGIHRIKPVDRTPILIHYCRDGSTRREMRPIVPKDGTLRFCSDIDQWVHLERGYCELIFEATDPEHQMGFELGQEALFKYRPWPSVRLQRIYRVVQQDGIIKPASEGDYVVDTNHYPPRFSYLSKETYENTEYFEHVPYC